MTKPPGCTWKPSVGELQLALQSSGGTVAEGVYLYNFVRSLTYPVTIYNMGQVCSAAVLLFLAAPRRVANKHAMFMIHRVSSTPSGDMALIDAALDSLRIDDGRLDGILREHVSLPKAKWRRYDRAPLWIGARDAIDCGIATQGGDFAPPLGVGVLDFSFAPGL